MDFQSWKAALINEIEIAAEGRAAKAFADPADPLIEKSQKALYDLAEQLRALPPDHAALKALFNEETELSNSDESEGRRAGRPLLRCQGGPAGGVRHRPPTFRGCRSVSQGVARPGRRDDQRVPSARLTRHPRRGLRPPASARSASALRQPDVAVGEFTGPRPRTAASMSRLIRAVSRGWGDK